MIFGVILQLGQLGAQHCNHKKGYSAFQLVRFSSIYIHTPRIALGERSHSVLCFFCVPYAGF